jgi:hypothetical protein
MIVVLSELHGAPRAFRIDRQGLIELARLVHDGPEEDQPPATQDVHRFESAWLRLRHAVRHARHFAHLSAALHFYRFGNHGLRATEVARILRSLRTLRETDAAEL